MTKGGVTVTHRVVVIDDHDMLREALASGLNRHENIEVIGSCGSVADFETRIKTWNPSVIVADYQLPDGTGIDIIKNVRARKHDTRVIIVTGYERVGLLHDVISSGGNGLLSKTVTLADLASAVVAVGCGASAFPPDALRAWAQRDLTDVGATLTPREREVLSLLAEAKSASTIATDLELSTNTVRNHIRGILGKLHVNSQLQAVVTAQREGLV
jgi:DNA-binding NarL/FixJ family response regulator